MRDGLARSPVGSPTRSPTGSPIVSIDRLLLRLAGPQLDEARARRLADAVAAALHERLRLAGITGQLHLARLDLRLLVSGELAAEDLPRAIADRIREALR